MCDVLLLEDDTLLRSVVAALMADEGLLVCEAETIPQALDLIRADMPRLLVADLNLGLGRDGADGHAFAEEAMRLLPGLAVIYISGEVSVLDGRHLTPRERKLPKPFSLQSLVRTAQEMLMP